MRSIIKLAPVNLLIISIFFSIIVTAQSRPQKAVPNPTPTPPVQGTENIAELREQIFALADRGQHLKALPLLEKVAPVYPNDAEVWAIYGISVLANSVVMQNPEMRQEEQKRGFDILMKAKSLGTKNTMALHFLDQLGADGSGVDNFTSKDPEYEKAIRAGEGFFGTGEYDKAFAEYEKAHKLQPKNYEPVLFLGDTLYAQGKYKESETWFAKAVEIAPNREQAYRFWGDALMFQKKPLEARDKFVEALIAEPFSRMTWDRLNRWLEETETDTATLEVIPPGNESGGDIKINESLLKTEDGTHHWKLYSDTVKASLAGKTGRYTLSAETSAWRKVAENVRKDMQAGKIKYPDKSLINLVKLDDAGLLEAYILIIRPHEDFGEDFFDYRTNHRDKLKRFIIEFLLGLKS